MSEVDGGFAEQFASISADLLALEPDDREGIVRIGASLEQSIAAVPHTIPRLVDLIGTLLEALQALYTGSVPDPAKLKSSINEAASAVSTHIGSENASLCDESLDVAMQVMRVALCTEDVAEDTTSEEAPNDASDVTLDDVAAMLVQTEPNDNDGVAKIVTALTTLEQAGGYEEQVRQSIISA